MNAHSHFNELSLFDYLNPEEIESNSFGFLPLNSELKLDSCEILKNETFKIYDFKMKKQIKENFLLTKTKLYQYTVFF